MVILSQSRNHFQRKSKELHRRYSGFHANDTHRSNGTVSSGRYTEVKEFYDYLLNRVRVMFKPKHATDDDSVFSLFLSRKMSYDQFAAKVGEHLNVDPSHLRFTTINATTGRSKALVRRVPNATLAGILVPSYNAYGNTQNQRGDALYFEVLEMSLSELEARKTLKVSLLSEGITKEVSLFLAIVILN